MRYLLNSYLPLYLQKQKNKIKKYKQLMSKRRHFKSSKSLKTFRKMDNKANKAKKQLINY